MSIKSTWEVDSVAREQALGVGAITTAWAGIHFYFCHILVLNCTWEFRSQGFSVADVNQYPA